MSSAVGTGAPVLEPVGAGVVDVDGDGDDEGAVDAVDDPVVAAAGENGSSDGSPDGDPDADAEGDEQDAAARNDNNTETRTDA